MTDTPILEAEAVLAQAIRDALAPYVSTYNTRPKVYYQLAEQGCPLPYVVFQFQTDISRMDWVGLTGATVLTTIRALASNAQAARSLLADVAPGMGNITIDDYVVMSRYTSSPSVPPSVAGVWQALHVYRLRIEAQS